MDWSIILILRFLLSPFQFLSRTYQYLLGTVNGRAIHAGESLQFVITRIRVTDVAANLGRIPVGFYVVVQFEGAEWKTANKPILSVHSNVVEWNEVIALPSGPASNVHLKIFASFELAPILGNGQLLRKLDVTVGELLDRSEKALAITFAPRDGGLVSPCPSILITLEPMDHHRDDLTTRPSNHYEEVPNLVRVTDSGHDAFLHYRKEQNRRDLDLAVERFQHALDICPLHHPCRAAAIVNLAQAKFVVCELDDTDIDVNVAISLYRDALVLRPVGHPDRPATLLQLGSVLLHRFQKHRIQTDGDEAEGLMCQVLDLCSAESYHYQSTVLTLETACREREGAAKSPPQDPVDHVRLISDENPDKPCQLSNLGSALGARFVRFGALRDINQSVSVLEDAVRLAPDVHPDKPLMLRNLGHSFWARFEHLGDQADIERAISAEENAMRLTPDHHPDRPMYLTNLGNSLWTRFERLGEIADIEKAISLQEEAVQATPDADENKPMYLNNLGTSLWTRFEHVGNLADIERAISVKQHAVRLTPDNHPDKPMYLSNLSSSLSARFKRLGDRSDIDKAISVGEDAMHRTPDGHPDRPGYLSTLSGSLTRRFEHFGDQADIDKAISVAEAAVRDIPDRYPNKPRYLANLGGALIRRFEHLGNLTDIEKAISVLGQAVRLTPDGHPQKPGMLSNFSGSLSTRFFRLGDLADLNKAISVIEDGVRLAPDDHPDKPGYLNNLGQSLSKRFECLGDIADMNKTILVLQDAVRLAADHHPEKPMYLSNLGNSLSDRFQRFGEIADNEKAIVVQEEAVQLTPDDHPNKPLYMNDLSASLFSHFEHIGDLAIMDKVVSVQEAALQLTAERHPDRPMGLNNLGTSLTTRYKHLRDPADNERAISLQEDAVRLAPDGSPNKPLYLTCLGHSLWSRFERRNEQDDIEKAISLYEAALQLIPDQHPDKSSYLNNLGTILWTRFEHFTDPVDMNKAILVKKDAARLTADDHPNKPIVLSNLGNSFSGRFECLGEEADIDQAISLLERAIQLTPDGHPGKLAYLTNLGISQFRRSQRLDDASALDSALLNFSSAARSPIGPSSTRFQASRLWTVCARMLKHDSLLESFAVTIDLLPQLAWIGLPLQDRHRHLREAVDVAREAASAAIEFGRLETAVEWLEQGRSVAWTQLLQLRTPLDELEAAHSELAGRLRRVSNELEQASTRDPFTFSNEKNNSLDKQAQRHRALARERERLIAEVRSLRGFEGFLLPKTIAQLRPSAHFGLVAMVVASTQRCDALIVTENSDSVLHVPLPDITSVYAEGLQQSLNKLLACDGRVVSSVARPARPAPQVLGTDDAFRQILSELWSKVVKPVLDALAFSTTKELHRVFWCPTGPFAFLPIHAAGDYDATNPGSKISDFAVSSYTPTLSALTLQLQDITATNISILAVPQPESDGQLRLPGARTEIEHIKSILTNQSSSHVTLMESDGTVQDVLAKMRISDWVHFACHGIQDPTTPLDSGLLLANKHRLTLSAIIKLSRPRGGLAFLSACQTATGDKALSEESVHLAVGMLLAGYSGVIATMWSIRDCDAPAVAKDVYEQLLAENNVPDCKHVAQALHRAIERLRERNVPFISWVPFIHVGL